ncbi:protein EARLY-RESPONSIVE TO DEHYDRATION 7, chloroplastic [Capsella rubella]|uniref:protein EARLY-RESPONSIVE TO DEHYDRATION 7, chloroplastic n=1 Tax=Capsella rubella TaxID=81985 RepID=UPI000CD5AE20|nr:protein EARLY-RESPONSIVE TO DEHYDRATION 7, chloroplastic [Capsella rubella]
MSSSTQQDQTPRDVKFEPLKLALSFSGEDGETDHEFQEDFMGEKSSSTSSKAIAEGTGHIIKGIFTCSNSYSKKIHKGSGVTTIAKEVEETSGDISQIDGGDNNVTKKQNRLNTNLQRVEKVWKASEAIGIMVLEGGDMVSSSMIAPVVKSKLGKALLSTAPGEVILASLDSFNKILVAAEAAEIQTHSATAMASTRLVSKSFGENAGKATGKILETTGSLGRTAWNIQKSLEPTFLITSEIVKNAPRQ